MRILLLTENRRDLTPAAKLEMLNKAFSDCADNDVAIVSDPAFQFPSLLRKQLKAGDTVVLVGNNGAFTVMKDVKGIKRLLKRFRSRTSWAALEGGKT